MGGGNGLKSHMAREKNAAKKAAEGKGGGGQEGMKARTDSTCAICKAPFTSVKMKAQLVGHVEAKHPKSSLGECFPGVDI